MKLVEYCTIRGCKRWLSSEAITRRPRHSREEASSCYTNINQATQCTTSFEDNMETRATRHDACIYIWNFKISVKFMLEHSTLFLIFIPFQRSEQKRGKYQSNVPAFVFFFCVGKIENVYFEKIDRCLRNACYVKTR